MSTFAVIPVKRFELAKQRLATAIPGGHRRALAEAMLSDCLLALRRVPAIDEICLVTADPTATRLAAEHGLTTVEDTGSSHSEAASLGVAHALSGGATRVLLAAADCPLIDPRELDELLARPTPTRSVLVVPDRHGDGTNALLLKPPNVITPAFGEGSRRRHTTTAATAGAMPEVVALPSMGLDIDTPEDLEMLVATLAATRGRAAHTRGLLNQLTRAHG
ncbi:2-phospho-L-lactate guanylyltransferase [Conexibacter sp. S30A1]|uniref:2-phospho-L-lactate guanylyltransferase n=1 Tax=Conexibacter sp. S30A1 TaxID=2937800 RepID=UPI00200C4B46|nr:2-phospho-L-lactate guanylyltransferase [Conexibacter sp. S30A1]